MPRTRTQQMSLWRVCLLLKRADQSSRQVIAEITRSHQTTAIQSIVARRSVFMFAEFYCFIPTRCWLVARPPDREEEHNNMAGRRIRRGPASLNCTARADANRDASLFLCHARCSVLDRMTAYAGGYRLLEQISKRRAASLLIGPVRTARRVVLPLRAS